MNRNRQKAKWSVLAVVTLSAFVLAVFVVGMATRTSAQQGTTVTVTISPTNPPTVSPDQAQISKSNGDQVDWVCPQCTSGFSIHFPQGTPFAGASFSQSNPASGKAQGNAQPGTYNYTVTVGGNTADPSVKLTP